jgi:sec-independent protein translocase protein TatB
MFGVGLPEMLVILVVAIMIFGPDRIPEFARQAGRMIRQVRDFARSTRDDIRTELGPEYASFELTDLDPRRAVRKYIQDTWDETDEDRTNGRAEDGKGRQLERGELPPYDADAT